ncbi:uncharacterized protein BDZ99DRAFT_470967 [Mytilinidion resinicola]|uniref:Ankyrin n=1 Tax=Mytilinidion resinicola TaxID=574789 RepID=A0A6A6Z3C7_9PEZI|nr:uncharacterized protein BDZ99DRAFT_470967 [Mytilinidion resinicola]KAF2815606.1 hypothetical protein BDZ99DRAFT_470967 [Mytilinidion resinicola]
MAETEKNPRQVDPRGPRISPEGFKLVWGDCNSNDPSELDCFLETLDPRKTNLRDGRRFGFEVAMRGGHYKMLEHLLNNKNVSIDSSIVGSALKIGSIPRLNFLRENGWEDTNMGLNRSPGYPNLGPFSTVAVGFYGRDKLVPNSGAILQAAISRGNIESPDSPIAHGAILANAKSVHTAVKSGSEDMMLTGHGYCDIPSMRAIREGNTGMVRILLKKGASMIVRGRKMLEVVKEGWVDQGIRMMVESHLHERTVKKKGKRSVVADERNDGEEDAKIS